ncbi:MAG: hypothetical protein P4L51_06275 [Puia sp.]|nr:hypothetical protein [Puia sp.]
MKKSKFYIRTGIIVLCLVAFVSSKPAKRNAPRSTAYTYSGQIPLLVVIGNFTSVAANGATCYFKTAMGYQSILVTTLASFHKAYYVSF